MGPKLPSQAGEEAGGRGAGSQSLLSTPLSRQLRLAPRAGRSCRSGWAGRATPGANPPPAAQSGAPKDCGRGCRGTAAGPTGKEEEEERELHCVAPNSPKSAPRQAGRRRRPKSAWRWSWPLCPGPHRGGLPRPPFVLSTAGFPRRPPGTSRSQRPWVRATLCPGHPVPAHTPWTRPLGAPRSLGKLLVILGNEEKGHRAKGAEQGRSGPCRLAWGRGAGTEG